MGLGPEPGSERDLRPLLAPRSVAVVGASDDRSKWGFGMARAVLEGEGRRTVHLVNQRRAEVFGRPAYPTLGDIPGGVECAVLAVPAAVLEDVVEDGLAAGVRAFVAITTGLGERDEPGRRRERALGERVRAAGAVLLGPNCMGVWAAGAGFNAAWIDLPPGPVALVAQSGGLGVDLAVHAYELRLGASHYVSVGNQADLTLGEVVDALGREPDVRAVGVYAEDFRDGRAFLRSVGRVVEAGVPVVVLAPTGAAAARAARSHTGALVSDARVVASALADVGAHLVATPEELMEAVQVLVAPHRPRGPRVAVLADGGGVSVISAGALAAEGMEVPVLSPALQARVRAERRETASSENPIDLTAVMADLDAYGRVLGHLLGSHEVDAALLVGSLGVLTAEEPGRTDETTAAEGMARVTRSAGKPLVAASSYPGGPVAGALRAGDVPVYRGVGAACRALALAWRLERGARWPVPEAPPDAPAPGAVATGYGDARALLAGYGIPFPPAEIADGGGAALAAAARIGYPVVLKALGRAHKSDDGGVILGIAGPRALAAAVRSQAARLGATSWSVERHVAMGPSVELVVGAVRDPRFGPVVLAGMGGTLVELLDDTAVGLAPVDPAGAERLLRRLRGYPALTGYRGRPVLDVGAAAAAVAALSRCAAERPWIAELEVNPLLVGPSGACALDARMGLAPDARPA